MCFLSVLVGMVLVIPSAHAAGNQYALQVGAWGDEVSRGNMGVGAEILTSIYYVSHPGIDHSFWVGDDLANGAFIQFGYELSSPGYYCLYGEVIGDHTNCQGSSEMIGSGDPRWFWQYWPNPYVVDFYYGIGRARSGGPNGAWHHYQIWPNVANGWDFVLDGQTVSFNSFQSTTSKDPAFVVAEEVTSLPSASGNLGPVEFRNLEYLAQNGWQQVQSLTAYSGCGGLSPNCGTIPYGVASLGANHIVAGAGVQQALNNQILWTVNPTLILQVPSQVQVTIDGASQKPGMVQMTTSIGLHNVSVPSFVQLDAGTRLRFIYWRDGSQVVTDPNIIIDLRSNERAEAIYVTQYQLNLISTFSASGGRWYDAGSTAYFSTVTSPQVLLGEEIGFSTFNGWYENSFLLSSSTNASLIMNGPHTLVADWQNVQMPQHQVFGVIMFAAAFVLIILILRKVTAGVQVPSRAKGAGTSGARTRRVCWYCGTQLAHNEKYCEHCRMIQD